ncbi:MAG: hypothetical protein LBV27_05600 [Oscillospiraceae bacterium]|jgi:hypothetical protein|nr:hypothetical protein [Oscillospiraceae bacterium]
MGSILNRILNQIGDQAVLDKLLSLSKADLNSLLLALFERQTNKVLPSEMLKIYKANRFSLPSKFDPVRYHALEAQLLTEAQNMNIQTILLSPSAPLGSCSVFGCVNQYNVISALRNTETLADPTNMLAITIADKLKERTECNTSPLHYATTARVVRGQTFSGTASYAHFGLYCMVSSGKDKGAYICEKELLEKHLSYYKVLFKTRFSAKLSIVLRKRGGYKDNDGFFSKMTEGMQTIFPDTTISIDSNDIENKYYQGINFKLFMEKDGEVLEIGDGGFVDWICQMLGSKKERCLISCIALDRLLLLDG